MSSKKRPLKAKKSSSTKRIAKSKNNKRAFNYKGASLYGATLLVILFAITAFGILNPNEVKKSKIASQIDANMYIESDNPIINKGDKLYIKLYSDSNDVSVNAVQSAISYPTELLRLDEIKSANSDYPVDAYQNTSGNEVTVVRGVVGGVKDKKLVSELEFTALSSGVASIAFNKYNTALVDATTNSNVLKDNSYNNLIVEVK